MVGSLDEINKHKAITIPVAVISHEHAYLLKLGWVHDSDVKDVFVQLLTRGM